MNEASLTNIHVLWDQSLIETRVQRNFYSNNSLYYDHIYKIMHNQTATDNDNKIEQWIEESIHYVCSVIYLDESNTIMNASRNFTLGEDYYNKAIPIIEQRLAQNGRRLGALLNQIAEYRLNNPSNGNNKLSFNTMIVIIMLSFEVVFTISYKKI